MSGVARIAPKLKMEPYEPPTTLHVNLKKHPGVKNVQVGKRLNFMGHGIVKSMSQDQNGHSMSVDVHKLSPQQVAAMKEQGE